MKERFSVILNPHLRTGRENAPQKSYLPHHDYPTRAFFTDEQFRTIDAQIRAQVAADIAKLQEASQTEETVQMRDVKSQLHIIEGGKPQQLPSSGVIYEDSATFDPAAS